MSLEEWSEGGYSRQGKQVLKRNDCPNLRQRGWCALSRAAYSGNLSIVKLLITEGANVNSQDKVHNIVTANTIIIESQMGHTTLMRATEYQHTEIVDYLLQVGADVNIQNNVSVVL